VAITTGATTTRISTDGGQTWTAGGALPASSTWVSIAYGANKFVAVSSDGAVDPAYSVDGGVTWSSAGRNRIFRLRHNNQCSLRTGRVCSHNL
jgi:hypothetical protein